MAVKVLIVDDDPVPRDTLRRSLACEGYGTETAEDGVEALEKTASYDPDLILLTAPLPRLDGLTVVRRLRACGRRTPILLLSARGTLDDRVSGLDSGADDYLVKPFEMDELLARARALLRRAAYAREPAGPAGPATSTGSARPTRPATSSAPADHVPADALSFADLRMDLGSMEVTRGRRAVELSRTEYLLLEMFLSHPRQVLTREQILKSVWGVDFEPTSNSLDVYVMYLRRKTEAAGEPRLVHTVRGVGYVLRDDAAA